MSKQLTIDEMLEAAVASNLPGAEHFVGLAESLGSALSQSLAAHLGVRAGTASFQPGFGGTCSPFYQREPEQECPDALAPHDEGEWDFATIAEIADGNESGRKLSARALGVEA